MSKLDCIVARAKAEKIWHEPEFQAFLCHVAAADRMASERDLYARTEGFRPVEVSVTYPSRSPCR